MNTGRIKHTSKQQKTTVAGGQQVRQLRERVIGGEFVECISDLQFEKIPQASMWRMDGKGLKGKVRKLVRKLIY